MHVRAAGGLARPSSENEGRVPPGDARETCDSPAGGVRNRAAGDFSVSSAFSVVHDLELAFVQEQTMSKVPMTVAGAERLRRELHKLKTVDRPSVIAAIAEARSHGDLSENADYDAAKERQSFIEGRIAEVESKLANAQVIDPAALDVAHVVFGATVELADAESGENVTYQIVGDDEADIKHGKISINSPIARALIGKGEGDTADVQAPGGVRSYDILSVRYG